MTNTREARIRQALSRLYGVVTPRTPPAAPGAVPTTQPTQGAEWAQAQALVAAIDAGGVPLNPARVNQIARSLGLEVSAHAPMEDTVARIRAALQRP